MEMTNEELFKKSLTKEIESREHRSTEDIIKDMIQRSYSNPNNFKAYYTRLSKVMSNLNSVGIDMPKCIIIDFSKTELYDKFVYFWHKAIDEHLPFYPEVTPEDLITDKGEYYKSFMDTDTLAETYGFMSELYKNLNDYITDSIEVAGLKYPLVLKTGDFMDKFSMLDRAIITEFDMLHIMKKALDTIYNGMCLGRGMTSQIVLKEFINVMHKPDIYVYGEQMPLNMEFRAFVNFDKNILVDIQDYYSIDLVGSYYKEDDVEGREKFLKYKKSQEKEFNKYKTQLQDKLTYLLSNGLLDCGLKKSWSIDFMLDENGAFQLIDMAVARLSYGYQKLDESKKRLLHKGEIKDGEYV